MIISDFLNNALKRQAGQSDFLPKISQHVTENIVHYSDGYFAFTVRLEGIPFESVNDNYLYNQFHQLALTFSGAGKNLGNRLAVWTTLQRKKRDFNRLYQQENIFCQEFTEKYISRFQKGSFFSNAFYITALIKYEDYDDGLKEILDLLDALMQDLQTYDPYVLTVYKNKFGIVFSEVYEFFDSLINYEYERIPLSNIDACEVLGDSDLHFGTDVVEIRTPNNTMYATCWDLKDFGVSKVKVLTGVLDLPCEFNFTQSFSYIENQKIQTTINKQINNLISVGDQAHDQHDELLQGKGGVTSGELMFGDYHAALVVYSDSLKDATRLGTLARARFQNSGGFQFKKAGFSAPITYFSQVPGAKKRPRSAPKTTVNLATTFGMHTHSHGKTMGNPIGDGSAVMPLLTKSNTIYDFNWHFSSPKEDNTGDKLAGHTLLLGATGVGKTTMETAMLTMTQRFNPFLFVLDLDYGMQIFMRAIGGQYFSLEAGKPTGLNPFQLPDTADTREFLNRLVGVCGQNSEGKLSAEEEHQIKHAIDTMFNNINFENRNFSVLLQSIPFSAEDNSLRTRLTKWCRSEGGRYAWCLDNPVNKFDPDTFSKIGFDLTDLLKENYAPTEPVLAYLFYLRNLMMQRIAQHDGLMMTVVEECWWPLRFNATKDQILKILKTDRKLGGWILLTTQSPEDVIQSDIFPAIVQQTPTKIYLPNPDAKFEGGYEKCGMTRKEFDELVKLTLDSRTFLVKQGQQSSFAKLDLYGFSDELAVLSGSANNIEILNQLMSERDFDSPNDWYPIFKERVKVARKAKRKI
ncbi:conjugal transfer protein [Advenella sp. WQ 585]|uniref:Conjugal transfer protein n=1 Tax=Advenella mandrilli TaxID=2800330 RepID=A0ABS1EEL9_9BURK|nr:conjugal transfer protein [Advenella mandrilli]